MLLVCLHSLVLTEPLPNWHLVLIKIGCELPRNLPCKSLVWPNVRKNVTHILSSTIREAIFSTPKLASVPSLHKPTHTTHVPSKVLHSSVQLGRIQTRVLGQDDRHNTPIRIDDRYVTTNIFRRSVKGRGDNGNPRSALTQDHQRHTCSRPSKVLSAPCASACRYLCLS